MSTEASRVLATYLVEVQLTAVEAQLTLLNQGACKDAASKVREFSKKSSVQAQSLVDSLWGGPEGNPYRRFAEPISKVFLSNLQSWVNSYESLLDQNPYADFLESYAGLLREAVHRAGAFPKGEEPAHA